MGKNILYKYGFLLFLLILASCSKQGEVVGIYTKEMTALAFPNYVMHGQISRLTVNLGSPAKKDVRVYWKIVDENGVEATDYFYDDARGHVDFLKGETENSISINTRTNNTLVGEKTFYVQVSEERNRNFKEVSPIIISDKLSNSEGFDTITIDYLTNDGYANIANQANYEIRGKCSAGVHTVALTISLNSDVVNQAVPCDATTLDWGHTFDLSSLAQEGPFSVKAIPSGENVPIGSFSQFVRDVTAPTLAATLPLSGSFFSQNNLEVSGTCSERGENLSVEIESTIIASIACSSDGTWAQTFNTTTLSDGPLSFVLKQRDRAGNETTVSDYMLLKQTSAPLIRIATPVENDYLNKSQRNAVVSGQCSVPGTNNILITGGVTSATTSCIGNSWTANVSFEDDVEKAVTVNAEITDVGGNKFSDSININLDTKAPLLTTQAPLNDGVLNKESDNVSSYPISGTCSEDTRNVSVSVVSSGGGTTHSQTVSCSGTSWTSALNLSGLNDGTLTVTSTHADAVGNSVQSVVTLTKDLEDPTLTITSPNGSYVNKANNGANFALSGSCSEATREVSVSVVSATSGSSPARTATCQSNQTWSVGLNTTGLGEGAFTVEATHSDAVGNSITRDLTLTKDTVDPTLAFSPSLEGTLLNTETTNVANYPISGTCSEDTRQVEIKVTTSNGPSSVEGTAVCSSGAWSRNLNLFSVADGTLTLTATHKDIAENSITTTTTMKKDVVDPTLAITSPATGAYINSLNEESFKIEGTCSDAGTNNIQMTGPGLSQDISCVTGTPNNRWVINADFSDLAPTEIGHAIAFTHTDEGGNTVTKTINLKKKITTVDVAITSPAANSWINKDHYQSFPVSGSCSPAGADIELTGDFVTQQIECSATSDWATNLNFNGNTEETVTVNAKLTDETGNNKTVSTTYKFDIELPEVDLTSPTKINIANNGTEFSINGTCSEVGRNVSLEFKSVSPEVVRTTQTTPCLANKTWVITVDTTVIPDGELLLTYEHSDEALNNVVKTASYTKDTGAPTLSLNINVPNPVVTLNAETQKNLVLGGTCSEANNASNISIQIGTETWTATCPTSGIWSKALDLSAVTLADGTLTINAIHTDVAGNSVTQTTTIDKDATAPTLAVTTPPSGSYVNTHEFTLKGSCSEVDQPVNVKLGALDYAPVCTSTGWEQLVNSTGIADGVLSFVVSHSDVAKNKTEKTDYKLNKQTAIDIISITTPSTDGVYVNKDNRTSFTVKGDCSIVGTSNILVKGGNLNETISCAWNNKWETTLTFADSIPSEIKTITAEITDSGGNKFTATRDVHLDTVSPSVGLTAPTLGNRNISATTNITSYVISGNCTNGDGDVTVKITSSKGGASITEDLTCSSTWSHNFNLTGILDGTLTVAATQTDLAGNSDASSITLTKDTQAPTVAITTSPSSNYINLNNQDSFSLEGTCSEKGSNKVTIRAEDGSGSVTEEVNYCDSGTPDWSRNIDVSSLADGSITITASQKDTLGNTGTSAPVTFTKNTQTVSVAILTPASSPLPYINLSNKDSFPEISGSCSVDGGPVELYYDSKNGTKIGEVNCSSGETWSFTTLDLSTLPEGPRTIVAYHKSAEGNHASDSVGVFKDTAPSAFSFSTPVDGDIISSANYKSFPVTGTCPEQGAVTFKVGAVPVGTSQNCNGAFSTTLDLSTISLGKGNHVLSASLVDLAENKTPVASEPKVNLVKDFTSENFIISNTEKYINKEMNESFRVYGVCDPGGFVGEEITVNYGTGSATTTCEEGKAWSVDLIEPFSEDMEETVTITADYSDPALDALTEKQFILDTKAPDFVKDFPEELTLVTNANVNNFLFSGECSEDGLANILVTRTDGIPLSFTSCVAGKWDAYVSFSSFLENGPVTLHIVHNDLAGNKTTVETTVNKQSTLPTLTLISSAYKNPINEKFYINRGNQEEFKFEGTCSHDGRKVRLSLTMDKETDPVEDGGLERDQPRSFATDCVSGTWEIDPELVDKEDEKKIIYSEGTWFAKVTHADEYANEIEIIQELIKDTLSEAIIDLGYTEVFDKTCFNDTTKQNFLLKGRCSYQGGDVKIKAPKVGVNLSLECDEDGEFEHTVDTLSVSGLSDQEVVEFELTQLLASGDISEEIYTNRYLENDLDSHIFGRWLSVKANGNVGAGSRNLELRFEIWDEEKSLCRPQAIELYRGTTPGAALGGDGVRVHEMPYYYQTTYDSGFNSLSAGSAYYYAFKARIADKWVDVTEPEESAEIRIIVPPENTVLVHRWIANKHLCEEMYSVDAKPSDIKNNYTCAYSGLGSRGGRLDIGHDLLVDVNTLGCNITSNCGASGSEKCIATNFSNTPDPASFGVEADIGAVFYDNSTFSSTRGQCWVKSGASATDWERVEEYDGILTDAQVSNMSGLNPLVHISRDRAYEVCEDKEVSLESIQKYSDNIGMGDTVNPSILSKRLLTQKEWRISAYWGQREYSEHKLVQGVYFDNVANMEIGLEFQDVRYKDEMKITTGCNSSHASISPTGAMSSSSCKSFYGVRDMVGNVWEWVSDEIECEDYKCTGKTSPVDPKNTDMNGFQFNGIIGPGGSNKSYDWRIQSSGGAVSYFNQVLGIPSVSYILGSKSISGMNLTNFDRLNGDTFSLYPSQGYQRRGALLGGGHDSGADAGRWTSYWGIQPHQTLGNAGVRCALPVE